MSIDDRLKELAGQAASRRSFLRAGGLAALASAGALSLRGAHAAPANPAASGAVASQIDPGELPADGALTLRLFRALTLLSISATIKQQGFAWQVQQAAHKELGRNLGALNQIGGGLTGYTPDPDGPICPDWWPWPFPWPPRRFDEVFKLPPASEIPKAGLAALDMFRTLSLYNLGFEHSDGALRAELQQLALKELNGQYGTLLKAGGLAGYDDGDGICPDWWPFPWPGPRPGPREKLPPDPALVLLDLARSLLGHNIALRFGDLGSQGRGMQLARGHVQHIAGRLGGFGGGAAAWEPGDGICPDWWPFPWPGPRRLGELLDPALALGDPDPEPNIQLRTTFEIFRGATVYALACQLDDGQLAGSLQSQAAAHIQEQAAQL